MSDRQPLFGRCSSLVATSMAMARSAALRQMLFAALCAWLASANAQAQIAITGVSPQAIVPGQTLRVEIAGQNFKAPLRLASSVPLRAQSLSVEPTKAVFEVTSDAATSLGPIGVWVAAEDAVSEPFAWLVDDLPSVLEVTTNHHRDAAQEVTLPVAIDGRSDTSLSDFYRVRLVSGQRLGIDFVAERIGSTMDGWIKVYHPNGAMLVQSDDRENNPDSYVAFIAPVDGDYVIEVCDSRYAGDARYRLRLGDLPSPGVLYPLAVQAGQAAALQWMESMPIDANASVATASSPIPFTAPQDPAIDRVTVGWRPADRVGGSWGEVLVRPGAVIVEPLEPAAASTPPSPVSLPAVWSGRLSAPKEVDTVWIAGNAGQAVRFQSRSRSLGSPAILRLQLIHPNGNLLAESAVGESEEATLDATLPENGTYSIRVVELLGRGGPSFAYALEALPSGLIAVNIKPDVQAREARLLEPERGAMFVDLQVQRFGYDGPVELELVPPPPGLRILNPIIPAKGAEQRVYLATDASWNPEAMLTTAWIARPTEARDRPSAVSSVGMRRTKQPVQPYPPVWMDGKSFLAATTARPPLFAFEHPASVRLPWPLKQHTVSLNVKRLQEAWKEPVSLLSAVGPEGWNAQGAVDKDTIRITLARAEAPTTLPSPGSIGLSAYAQTTYGRIEGASIPIEWFDPLKLEWELPGVALPGESIAAAVRVQRSGPEVREVTLQWTGLPPGTVAPAPVVLAADATEARLPLTLPKSLADSTVPLQLVATSKFGESDFQVVSSVRTLALEAAPTRVESFPNAIALHRARDVQRIAVTGYDPSNTPRDWTERAHYTIADPTIARWENGRVVPIRNGQTSLSIELAQHSLTVPISVGAVETPSRIEFENEVLVALSKQGCNSGACHGSPSGKGNFRLSLRAFDKQLDALTLVREESGRRLNALQPDRSLLLLKPLMKSPHGGGVQLHTNDPAYAVLRDWIAQGHPLDPADQPRCVRLEVYPSGLRVMPLSRGQQQLVVLAHFADGTSRDVSAIAAYESSNTSVATIDAAGRIRPIAKGETVVLVRFLEHIESLPFLFVEESADFVWNPLPQSNFIDALVDEKLKLMQIQPSPACSDDVFLRRVYLDVLGILPTPQEAAAFLSDSDPNKRPRLIDTLLDRPEHAKFWAMKWGDLLRMTSKSVGNEAVYKYYRWVEQALRDNMPYDVFAKQLLGASGSTYSNPPANFYRTAGDTNDCVETISQVFLGARLQCAKCHNHPFERWTQDNYYGLGAVFQRVQRKKTPRPNEWFVWNANAGEVTQPRTGQVMKPWVPVQGELQVAAEEDRRQAFVAWLVQPDNPFFARVEANRIWSQLFARGLVDPIDDFRDSNPPTNRPLLDALTESFVASGYDRRALIRTILMSRTYQASYETNPSNERDTLYFSHQQPRLLGAEQLLDAMNQLTQVDQSFGTLPPGTRATQIPAPDVAKVDFLKVFGQPERSTVCACERSEDSNLSMAIELFNGSTIYDKLRNPNNRFRKALAENKPPEEIVRELYLAGLSRAPTADELSEAMKHIQSRGDLASGLEDLCWVLINTDEFLFQH